MKTLKYQELIELVSRLEPGKSIVIEFKNRHAAHRARTVVRDEINLRTGKASIRTRLINNTVYFTHLKPEDVVETDK